MTRVVHPRAWEERSVEASIESFRASFKRLGIPETDVKVTWDTESESKWSRVRMRLPSGAFVEHTERYDPKRHPRESTRDTLWTLARWLDAGSRLVKKGASPDAVFSGAIATEPAR